MTRDHIDDRRTWFEIVKSSDSDAEIIGRLIFEAVRFGATAYDEEQRRLWAPLPKAGPIFEQRLADQMIRLAVLNNEDAAVQKPVGFMTLLPEKPCEDRSGAAAPSAYIDFAYILKDYQGLGLFQRLYNDLENEAMREFGITYLYTHASLMARRAFEKVGFKVLESEEVVMIDGTSERSLKRFVMEKHL